MANRYKFTDDQKVKILREYEVNGNVTSIAKKHNISRNTLNKWIKSIGPKVFNQDIDRKKIKEKRGLSVIQKEVILKHEMAKESLLDKIITDINTNHEEYKPIHFMQMAKAINLLAPVTPVGTIGAPGQTGMQFFQQINNLINLKQDGQASYTAD